MIERERVRVLRFRVRHRVLGDLAGFRIELADDARVVAGEPDVAVLVLDQAVRRGLRRLERVFADLPGLRVDAPQLVGELPGVPDGAVARGERVMRARARRRHLPLADVDLRRAGNDLRDRHRPLGEVPGQVVDHRDHLVLRDRHPEVHHHADGGVPVRLRIARGDDAGESVAAAAVGLDRFLAGPVGQVHRLLLRVDGHGRARQGGGQRGQQRLYRHGLPLLLLRDGRQAKRIMKQRRESGRISCRVVTSRRRRPAPSAAAPAGWPAPASAASAPGSSCRGRLPAS
ncbi:hypothetical protein D3C83_00500 [compost metagenome]